jgi:hypothetical protein
MTGPKKIPADKFPPSSNEPFPKMGESSLFQDINAEVDSYGVLIQRDPGRLQAKMDHCAGLKNDFYGWVSSHPKANQFESAFAWCNPRDGEFWARFKRTNEPEVVVNTGTYFGEAATQNKLIETGLDDRWVQVSCLNYDIIFLDFMSSGLVFLVFVVFLTILYVKWLFKKIYSTFNWKRYVGIVLTTFIIFPLMQIISFFSLIIISKIIRKGMSIYILAMCAFNV